MDSLRGEGLETTKMRILSMAALVTAVTSSAAFAAPVVYDYSDQGVAFELTVNDTGAMVTATLEITSDGTAEFLKYAGLKLFSGNPPAFTTGMLTASPAAGYTFINGARSGASNGGLGAINSVNSGFVGADNAGAGPSMLPAGTVFTFAFKWNTAIAPLVNPSIKMWTAEADGTKSRQWSSGRLTPGDGVPEPASLVLLGVGALYVARRKRA